jgi:hypothetical protein
MAIGDDFSVAANGDIRHISGTTVYTVLQLHEWLQNLADDAAATGDDALSILTSNPSKLDGPRSAIKPMLLNLLSTFNIDDTASHFFNFGSIQQNGTNELYTGTKTIGSPLVAATPMYIVQAGSKITKFWSNGHIQVLIKGKTAGALIDNGDIRVFSRKYGQTYGDFSANLVAGGEQPAAISTSVTDWTPLDLASALALSAKVTISVGDSNHDAGDGNGSKSYKGTITLSGGCTIAEAAQYCQAICDEASTTTINGELGWKYRQLNAAYAPNASAPFGSVAGGKWFVAQGWWITGALAADSQKYQMVSHDATPISNPVTCQIEISGVIAGTRVVVGRDTGTGWNVTEYTLSGATTSGGNTCVMTQAIKADTPDTGYLRVNGIPYTYTALNRATRTFTISGTWGQIHAISSPAWCPFIDVTASGTTVTSPVFTKASVFTARVKARKGAAPNSLQPAEATFSVDSGVVSYGVIMNSDE